MPRRQSARLKNVQDQKGERAKSGTATAVEGCAESSSEILIVSDDDENNDITTRLSETDSPVKLDASLTNLISQINAQSAAHEAECVDIDDEIDNDVSIISSPSSSNDKLRTIFVRHSSKKFGFTPFKVDADSSQSLLSLYKQVSALLNEPVYSFHLQYKCGDGLETLRPGRSLREQEVGEDVVLLECVDEYPLEASGDELVSVIIQRLAKRREGVATASAHRVTLPFPRHELARYLLRTYCQHQGLADTTGGYRLVMDGETLSGAVTLADLDIEDGDVIDCQLC